MKKIPAVMTGIGLLLFLTAAGIQTAMQRPENLRQDVCCAGEEGSIYAAQNGKSNYVLYQMDGSRRVRRVYTEKRYFATSSRTALALFCEQQVYVLGRQDNGDGSSHYFIRRLSDTLEEEMAGDIRLDGKRALSLERDKDSLMLTAVSEDGQTQYRYRVEMPEGAEQQVLVCTLTREEAYRPQAVTEPEEMQVPGPLSCSLPLRMQLAREHMVKTAVLLCAAEVIGIPLALLGADKKRRVLRGFVLLYAGFVFALPTLYVCLRRLDAGPGETPQEYAALLWFPFVLGTEYIWLIYCYIVIGMNKTIRRMEDTASKQRAELKHSCDLYCHACQRFVPKMLPGLLQKQSVLDVAQGDHAAIRAVAAVLPLGQSGRQDSSFLEQCQAELAVIQEACRRQNGMLFADSCNLTLLKLLFRGEGERAVSFAVETLSLWNRKKLPPQPEPMILLHEDTYLYGITGTGEQAFPFLLSRRLDALESYLERLQELGLRLVLTQEIAASLSFSESLRYIGYVTPQELMQDIKLYEVTDVYEEKQRTGMLRSGGFFEKALQLYYQRDFYLARYNFSEALKECAEDRVAKWHLFRCEKRLEEEKRTDGSLALFAE